MATRWYIGADSTTITPSASSSWGIDNYSVAYEARTSGQTPSNIDTLSNPSETDGNPIYVSLNTRWKTKSLASQTINSGTTFRLQTPCNEGFAAANCKLHLKVRHFNSSHTQQGSDYSATGPTEFSDASVISRYVTVTLGSDITVSDGDYLVFEIGIYFDNSKTTSYTGVVLFHYNSGWSDLPSDETETSQTMNSWIECSQTLNFYSAEAYTRNPYDSLGPSDSVVQMHGVFKTNNTYDVEGVSDYLDNRRTIVTFVVEG